MNKAMKPSCVAKVCVCAAVCALNAGAADFLVKEFGAKGDGVTFDTEAVQKAIDACAADGGGRVVLEKGIFLVKPIMLKSGVNLHIARNARLLGSGDWRDYPNRGNLKHVISENMPRARDAALITADEAHGISITGEDVIDGNGMSFVEELPKEKWGRWRYGRVGGFSQFALAAFVNGCPGYAFYSGVCYDGEVLLKMMEAQDEIARYEGLPWGKVDGKAEPKCANRQFAFASTVRPDGTEVVALFNYEADETIRVSLGGREYEVEPFGVRFAEILAH